MLPLKALLRLYRSHPWLLLMSLAGLVLGVSLVVAIELLNHSARTNFVAARSQLAGEANYRLVSSFAVAVGYSLKKVVRNSLISSVVMESTVPSLCTAFGV